MKTKHSPGPWDIHGDLTHQAHYIHGANRVCDIAKPEGFYRSPAETEANARLIAAAPELLEALRQTLAALNTAFEAEGDTFGIQHNSAVEAVIAAESAISKAEASK